MVEGVLIDFHLSIFGVGIWFLLVYVGILFAKLILRNAFKLKYRNINRNDSILAQR